MVQIELIPDNLHCIETVARKAYNDLVGNYLQAGEGNSDFEAEVELLRAFLESADFRKLRKESGEYLVKGQKIKFILYCEQEKTGYRIVCI